MTPLFSSTDNQSAGFSQPEPSCQWQVRAAQPEDLTAVVEILADSFHSHQGFWGWAYPLLRLGIYEDMRNRLLSTAPHHACLVATELVAKSATTASSDMVAGTVEMALRSPTVWSSDRLLKPKPACSKYPYLSNLAVHPNYRRQGVAKQLLLRCESLALSWGFQDIYLHVLENNQSARQLYFHLGYQLHQVDSQWSTWFLRRPRQLLLHKHLENSSQ